MLILLLLILKFKKEIKSSVNQFQKEREKSAGFDIKPPPKYLAHKGDE